MKRVGKYQLINASQYDRIREMIRKSRNIVFFGGAGVSTASGIPDFRSKNGIYRKKSYGRNSNESMLTHKYYEEHKEEFLEKYRNSLNSTPKFPNPAHQALKELEDRGVLKAIITQNVDGLHQKAGSGNIIELHGNHGRQYCENCGIKYDTNWYLQEEGIRYCDSCGGVVRPEMVLFGEMLDNGRIEKAKKAVEEADTFIIGGSSLAVYPAAGLLRHYRGDQMIFINEEPTKKDKSMDYIIYDDISKVLPKII